MTVHLRIAAGVTQGAVRQVAVAHPVKTSERQGGLFDGRWIWNRWKSSELRCSRERDVGSCAALDDDAADDVDDVGADCFFPAIPDPLRKKRKKSMQRPPRWGAATLLRAGTPAQKTFAGVARLRMRG